MGRLIVYRLESWGLVDKVLELSLSINVNLRSLFNILFDLGEGKKLGHLFTGLALSGFLVHLFLIFMAKNGLGDTQFLSGLNPNYLEAIYTPFSFILF